ncbi:hypothetical protein [[Mycoplasma] testudinis]|uniref:hypothetical protein n=1 Tax=[Mycoplasma] testudinis TaxID=33924 RepID=UPI000482ADDA|nr:hypothetical protein [[Mycoplasma] testudinis]
MKTKLNKIQVEIDNTDPKTFNQAFQKYRWYLLVTVRNIYSSYTNIQDHLEISEMDSLVYVCMKLAWKTYDVTKKMKFFSFVKMFTKNYIRNYFKHLLIHREIYVPPERLSAIQDYENTTLCNRPKTPSDIAHDVETNDFVNGLIKKFKTKDQRILKSMTGALSFKEIVKNHHVPKHKIYYLKKRFINNYQTSLKNQQNLNFV